MSSIVPFTAEGMTVDLKRAKNDQEGEGRLIGIPLARTRPVVRQKQIVVHGESDRVISHVSLSTSRSTQNGPLPRFRGCEADAALLVWDQQSND
jgi:hypothetical protein